MTDTAQKTKRKARRKLSEFDFSSQDSHIALVGPAVGGPANERETLIIKSTKQFSEEFLQKMQQVRVTMELPDFLEKFFYLWEEDAMTLAKLMGYIEIEDLVEQEEPKFELLNSDFQDMVLSKIESMDTMKSLHSAEDITKALSELDESQYLSLLKDQERLENVFKKMEKNSAGEQSTQKQTGSTEVNSEVGADTEALKKAQKPTVKVVKYSKDSTGGWKPTDLIKVENEDNMSEKQTTVTTAEVEVVEKSQFEAMQVELQKALDAQKEELQKALDLVKKFEEEKKEAIAKAKLQSVKDAVKDEAKAELLFKAVGLVEDQEDFEAIVKALKEMTELVEKSSLFEEQGVSVQSEGTDVKESAVAAVLKARIKTK